MHYSTYNDYSKPYPLTRQQIYNACPPMSCMVESPDSFKGHIYLGNLDAASDYELLRKHNIKAVLTVASKTGLMYNEQLIPNHEIILCDDHPYQNLKQYFQRMYDFMDQNLEKTNILVHCFAGISRSATAVIMYLMKKNLWTFDKCYYYCKNRRPVVNPNPGFVKQLREYEQELQNDKINFKVNEFSQNFSGETVQDKAKEYKSKRDHILDDLYSSVKQYKQSYNQGYQYQLQNTEYVSPQKYLRPYPETQFDYQTRPRSSNPYSREVRLQFDRSMQYPQSDQKLHSNDYYRPYRPYYDGYNGINVPRSYITNIRY